MEMLNKEEIEALEDVLYTLKHYSIEPADNPKSPEIVQEIIDKYKFPDFYGLEIRNVNDLINGEWKPILTIKD